MSKKVNKRYTELDIQEQKMNKQKSDIDYLKAEICQLINDSDNISLLKNILGQLNSSTNAYPELNLAEYLPYISSEYPTLSEEDKKYLATKIRESVENIEKFVIYKFFSAIKNCYGNSVAEYSLATKSLSLQAQRKKLADNDYHNISKFNKLFTIDYKTIYNLISIPTINGKQIRINDKITKLIEERNVIKIFNNFACLKKDGTRKNTNKRYVVDYKMVNKLLLNKDVSNLNSNFYNKKIVKMIKSIKNKDINNISQEKETIANPEIQTNLKNVVSYSNEAKIAKQEIPASKSLPQRKSSIDITQYKQFLDKTYVESCISRMYNKISEDLHQETLTWENISENKKTAIVKSCHNALQTIFECIAKGILDRKSSLHFLVMFGMHDIRLNIPQQTYISFEQIDENDKKQYRLRSCILELLNKIYDFGLRETNIYAYFSKFAKK